jgi:hypothetical protein
MSEGLPTPARFGALQKRAARAGHQLLEVDGGYMLLRGSVSHHAADLDAIAVLLALGGAR